jgi:eukaryotic-like serine/threonine-protein kinase
MRKEENFGQDLSGLFDEAYDIESTPLMDSLQSGQQRYHDFTFYKEGGIKKIQICHDRKANRMVAMATPKVKADTQKIEAFLREAKVNAALQHPNIVPVYNVGIHDGQPWFTMKYIKGQSLEEVIEEAKAGKSEILNNLNDRLDVFIKICEAISYAHSLGVLHLDLKPDNIRISDFGDVVVCDWGLADVVSSRCDESLLEYCTMVEYDLDMMTIDGVVKGTIGYMAPEQTTKTDIRKGPHTDIFSLGALLYTLLCNEKAFDGKHFEEVLEKTARCEFPKPSCINPEVPSSLEAVCLKAMSLKVEDRFSSIEELKADIQAYRNGFTTVAEKASLLKFLKLLYLRHQTVSIISLLVVALLTILAILSVNHLSLTKANALQLAEKMRIEAEYHRKINKDAAPSFFKQAQVAYKTHSLDDAVSFVSTAVELNNTLKDAWLLKAKLHFINGEFKQALTALDKSQATHGIRALSEKYKNIKKSKNGLLPIKNYLEILKTLAEKRDFEIFGKMVGRITHSSISLKDRILFCKEVIHMRHKHKRTYKPLKFKFDKATKHLDISNNKWLANILCLQNFPATSINASNTGLFIAVGFQSQNLTSLDISSSNITALQSLNCKNLKYLNIANCAIPNLTPITALPLEVIDVRNTGLRSLSFAIEFKNLREIHVNKDQFSQAFIDGVPAHIKLVYQPRNRNNSSMNSP